MKLAEGTAGFSYADCRQANGGDVRFTLGDGKELPSECVSWNTDGTSEFWVRVPGLTAQTRVLVFWGNASAGARDPADIVWGKDYHAVLSHDDVGVGLLDKTHYANHGAANGGSATNGVVGVAKHYNGNGGWFGAPADAAFKSQVYTLDFWVRRAGSSGGDMLLICRGGGSYDRNGFMLRYLSAGNFGMTLNNQVLSGGAVAPFNTWRHVMFVCNGSSQNLFVDGKSATTGSRALTSGLGSIFDVGRCNVTGYTMGSLLEGDLDEVRFSSIARSADYAKAVFMNVASNDVFQTVEAAPATATSVSVAGEAAQETGDGVRYVADGAVQVYADGVPVVSAPADAKHVVTVTPMKKQYRVSVAAGAGGSVSPTLDGEWRDAGTELALTATATAAGKAFFRWDGDIDSTISFQPKVRLKVEGPITLTAKFGTARYVNPAEGYSDENDGLSAATAKATLQATVAAIDAAGDYPSVVFAADGRYTGTKTGKNWEVSLTNAIAVKAVNAHKAVFDIGAREDRGWFKLLSKNAYLEGLVVSNYSGIGTSGDKMYGYYVYSTGGCIENCRFERSYTCGRERSALQLDGGWMRNSLVRNLDYKTSASGDGLGYCRGVNVSGGTLVENCVISNCYGRKGQAISGGSGTFRNCLIAKCKTTLDSGGGVYVDNPGLILENCTVAGCSTTAGNGGGIYAAKGVMTVNCTIGENTSKTVAGGYNINGAVGQTHLYCEQALVGNGNVVGVPSFTNTAECAYYPTLASLSRETGLYRAWAGEPDALDLAGTNRVLGTSIDIGCYEFPPPAVEPLSCSVIASVNTGTDALSVDFSATVNGRKDGLTYAWDFGDGATSTEAQPHHDYAKPGYFTVTLTVSNSFGEEDTFVQADMIKVYATVCYVSNTGSNEEPYGSWETAARSLTDVLLVGPKKVVVAAGSYSISSSFSPGAIEVVGASPTNTIVTLANGHNSNVRLYGTRLGNMTFTDYYGGYSPGSVGFAICGTGTVVSNCIIKGFTSWRGPAVDVQGGDARMFDCVLINHSLDCGAVLSLKDAGSGTMVDRCVVSNNTGFVSFDKFSSLIQVGSHAVAPAFRNCLVERNDVKGSNASLFCSAGACQVENCTIVSNSVAVGGRVAGVHVAGSGLELANTILWDNYLQVAQHVVVEEVETVVTNWVASAIAVDNGKSATFRRVCAFGLPDLASAAVTVDNCLSVDPKFNAGRKPALPYYSLRRSSPCLNRGAKAAWMEDATDLAGNPRLYGSRPDLGCYELQSGTGLTLIVR